MLYFLFVVISDLDLTLFQVSYHKESLARLNLLPLTLFCYLRWTITPFHVLTFGVF